MIVLVVLVAAAATLWAVRALRPEPTARLSVGIGMESLADTNFDDVARHFDAAGVSEFSLAIGRGEWVAFPWEGHDEYWSGIATQADETGTDPVDAAVSALREAPGGWQRDVTLTIDALAPATISEDSDYAGEFSDGEQSDSIPSAYALEEGQVGEDIVALCGETANRYEPTRIALTEVFGDAFFSAKDEELYSEMTGNDGFPRTAEDDIDTRDASLHQWQSDIITGLIERCGDAAGVPVEIDSRVNWDDLGEDNTDNGNLYGELLDHAGRVSLWAYMGLNDAEPGSTKQLVQRLRERFGEEELNRFTISVGLWASGDDHGSDAEDATYSAEDMRTAVDKAAAGPGLVAVTPLSKMTQEHWDALAEADAAR